MIMEPASGPAAMVIGATGALGSATARVFRQAGWNLGIAGRAGATLDRLAAELEAAQPPGAGGARPGEPGPLVLPATWDAADPGTVERAFQSWDSALGAPDACLYLAGRYGAGRPAQEWGAEEWRIMLEANLLGAAFSLSAAGRRMVASGRGGTLLAVGAPAGLEPASGRAPYAVSKAGLVHLIRCLAEEGKAHAIRANALVPTILDTPANRSARPTADFSRWTSTETAARVLLWLASPEARTVTGSMIRV
jgi:NAD(P)-dependent dehydrogenase (short-subunit alcohol dehydrogenase family)